jgi:hypothetical protein
LLTGRVGSGACSGLISMNPAPRSARPARQVRQVVQVAVAPGRRDRTEYSWTVRPQYRCPGIIR